MNDTPTPVATHPPTNGLVKLATDLGPLVIFLISYKMLGIFNATGIFMATTAAALIFEKMKFGRISPLLIFSSVMVLIMGGLTLWLHNETFIKLKPTLYYLMVSGILFYGMFAGRPMLREVMGAAYPDLSEQGWYKLSRNFAWFFLVMAVANELVWRNNTTSFWIGYKLWGALPATFLFGALNIPMIMRHSESKPAA